MSITFDVNRKALQDMGHQALGNAPVQAAIDGRVKAATEASGANHAKVIGGIMDPSVEDMYESLDEKTRTKYAAEFKKSTRFAHGFMETVHLSYAKHYPLILTPDSVWLTIAQGFGNHVNLNAEKLRKRFVSHEGKKEIILRRDSFVKGSPNNDWQGCFNEFSDKIAEHIGKKRDLIVGDFSTTGLVERAVADLTLMDGMKSYFKYGVMTLCGIPRVTLTGTVEDWRSIRTRAENLSEFECDWWIKSLVPVLDQFVAAAEGNPDIKFWDTLYKQDGGSGGPHCTGWCNVLFPYLTDNKGTLSENQFAKNWNRYNSDYGPTMDAYPNSVSSTPFKWQIGMGTYDMAFLGGLVGTHQHEDLSIEPAIGWAVLDKKSFKNEPINIKEDW